MQIKANRKQTLWVFLIALILVFICIAGLWAYVKSADAETGVTETALVELPEADSISVTREKYDNYPPESGTIGVSWKQGERLFEDEIKRLNEIKKAYAAGARPKDKAPSLPGMNAFAIIPLDPSEYAGMTEYYILPEDRLTDDHLLMLIDYGEETGVSFTENTLTSKNCMRLSYTDSNRYLSAGESERQEIMKRRIWTEGLRSASPELTDQKLPVSGMGSIRLNPELFSGAKTFYLYPIRELTDEELLQSLYLEYMDGYTYLIPTKENGLDPVADTVKMRALLEDIMGMPMAAESTSLSYKQKDATGEIHLHAVFNSALIDGKETSYYVIMLRPEGDIIYAWKMTSDLANPNKLIVDDEPKPDVNINDPRWADIAKDTVSKLTNVKIKSAPVAEVWGSGQDASVQVNVNLEDGACYFINVQISNGITRSAQYIHKDVELINGFIW